MTARPLCSRTADLSPPWRRTNYAAKLTQGGFPKEPSTLASTSFRRPEMMSIASPSRGPWEAVPIPPSTFASRHSFPEAGWSSLTTISRTPPAPSTLRPSKKRASSRSTGSETCVAALYGRPQEHAWRRSKNSMHRTLPPVFTAASRNCSAIVSAPKSTKSSGWAPPASRVSATCSWKSSAPGVPHGRS